MQRIISVFILSVLVFSAKVVMAGPQLKLPYAAGESWRVDQGNNSTPTHTAIKGMAYAWDFNWGVGPDDLGRPVLAPAAGMVVAHSNDGSYNGGWGNMVRIDYGGGFYGRLVHLDEVFVKTGDSVVQGQIIGTCGGTGGWSPHIHYQTENTNGQSVASSFMDSDVLNKETDGVPKEGQFYTSSNTIVGITPAGPDALLTWQFRTAYDNHGGSSVLGAPFSDSGGSPYVHLWWGAQLQNFAGGTYGTDGQSALVWNPVEQRAQLIKEGFWCVYKGVYPDQCYTGAQTACPMAPPVQQVFGPTDLGTPRSDEQDCLDACGRPAKCQIFTKAKLVYASPIRVYFGDFSSEIVDPPETSQCVYPDEVHQPSQYYAGLLFNGKQEICGAFGWRFLTQGREKGGKYLAGTAMILESLPADSNQYLTDVHVGTNPSFAFPVTAGVTYRFSGLLRSPQGSRRVIIGLTRQSNYGLTNRRQEVDQTLAKPCDITVNGAWQEYTCDFPVLDDEPEAALRFFSGTPVGELHLADLWLEELGDSTLAEISQMIGTWAPGRGNGTITSRFKAVYDSSLGLPSPDYEDDIPFVHAWRDEFVQFFPDSAMLWSTTRAYALTQPFWYAYYTSKTSTSVNLGSPIGDPVPQACGAYTCQVQPFRYGSLTFDPRLPDRVTQTVGSSQSAIFLPPDLVSDFSGPRLVFTTTPNGPIVTILWATNPDDTLLGVQGTLPATRARGASIWISGRKYDNEIFVLPGTNLYYLPGQAFTLTVTDSSGNTRTILLDQWTTVGGVCTASGCVGP